VALDLVLIFALLSYIRNQKMQKKIKLTPTTNPNPNPKIEKAAKQKGTD